MSKAKLLHNIAEDMRSIANSISALADAMQNEKPQGSTELPVTEPAEKTEEPTISLVEVRTRLGELSRSGYTTQIKELIQKFGADRLGGVDPKHYEALLKEAEGLANAT